MRNFQQGGMTLKPYSFSHATVTFKGRKNVSHC